jgi:hypothetical protein
MDGSVKSIILTAEYLNDTDIDYNDLNTDVIVQFDNGDKYSATFFSVKNLQNMIDELDHLQDRNAVRQYYKIMNMVLVKDFNQGDLQPIIEAMLSEGDFQLIFKKI